MSETCMLSGQSWTVSARQLQCGSRVQLLHLQDILQGFLLSRWFKDVQHALSSASASGAAPKEPEVEEVPLEGESTDGQKPAGKRKDKKRKRKV